MQLVYTEDVGSSTLSPPTRDFNDLMETYEVLLCAVSTESSSEEPSGDEDRSRPEEAASDQHHLPPTRPSSEGRASAHVIFPAAAAPRMMAPIAGVR